MYFAENILSRLFSKLKSTLYLLQVLYPFYKLNYMQYFPLHYIFQWLLYCRCDVAAAAIQVTIVIITRRSVFIFISHYNLALSKRLYIHYTYIYIFQTGLFVNTAIILARASGAQHKEKTISVIACLLLRYFHTN